MPYYLSHTLEFRLRAAYLNLAFTLGRIMKAFQQLELFPAPTIESIGFYKDGLAIDIRYLDCPDQTPRAVIQAIDIGKGWVAPEDSGLDIEELELDLAERLSDV